MARVIKGQKDIAAPPKVIVAEPKQVTGGRVIDRDVYRAGINAKQIISDGENKRKQLLAEGLHKIDLASEEAISHGATTAIAEAAKKAVLIFFNKAKRNDDIREDLHILVLEMVKKISGTKPLLEDNRYKEIIERGLDAIINHRKIKLQFTKDSFVHFPADIIKLLDKVKLKSDFIVEEAADVPSGYVRVVTDVGSVLCEEKAAFDALSVF